MGSKISGPSDRGAGESFLFPAAVKRPRKHHARHLQDADEAMETVTQHPELLSCGVSRLGGDQGQFLARILARVEACAAGRGGGSLWAARLWLPNSPGHQ